MSRNTITSGSYEQRRKEIDTIDDQPILELFEKMPDQGLFFHGGKAQYAAEKAEKGLKYETNSYFFMRKPTSDELHDPRKKAEKIETAKAMFANLFGYAADASSPFSRGDYFRHFNALSDSGIDPLLTANFYAGPKGANFLPVIFVAKVPDNFVDPHPEDPSLISIVHVGQFPTEPTNFVAIESLDLEGMLSERAAGILTTNILEALAREEENSIVRQRALRRLEAMGIVRANTDQ